MENQPPKETPEQASELTPEQASELTPEQAQQLPKELSASEIVKAYFEDSQTVNNLEKQFNGQALNATQDLVSKIKAELLKQL